MSESIAGTIDRDSFSAGEDPSCAVLELSRSSVRAFECLTGFQVSESRDGDGLRPDMNIGLAVGMRDLIDLHHVTILQLPNVGVWMKKHPKRKCSKSE